MIFSLFFSPINIILGILLIEYALFKCRQPMKVVEERDSKYSAFRRYDVKQWKRWRLYLGAPFLLTRFLISLCCPLLLYLSVKIVLIGHKTGNPIPKNKQNILKKAA